MVHGGLRLVGADADGHRRVISESYRGDSIGLLGLLPRVSAPADAYAIRDSTLLRLTRARFEILGRRHPELVVRLAEGVARLGLALLGRQPEWTTWSRPGAMAQNFAVLVPNRDPAFARAAADLARTALQAYRRVGWVTRGSVDAALGEGTSAISLSDARNERVLAYLQGLEQGSEIVLYECDSEAVAWSLRCLRQADRVLVIVRGDVPEHLEEMRAMLQFTLQRGQVPRLDVALVHPQQAEVPRRKPDPWRWLPESARLHHVRMGNRADYERLARTLVRTGVGVVLSGGGAKGIAHLGVLQALEEAKIPVDAIAGTSMGAIMAAGYARGWSASELMVRIPRALQQPNGALRPDHPVAGPARGAEAGAGPAPILRWAEHRGPVAALLLRLHQPQQGRGAGPRLREPLAGGGGQLLDPRDLPTAARGGRPARRRRRDEQLAD
ncbi:MAG: cyclic nucleotide-binding and patatin-like phospholipase domain-containing protein [Myxococcales bacterium]